MPQENVKATTKVVTTRLASEFSPHHAHAKADYRPKKL